jgi:hypothetical protein
MASRLVKSLLGFYGALAGIAKKIGTSATKI